MNCVKVGHTYELGNKESTNVQTVNFLQQIGEQIVQYGTTNEEVIKMMLDRMMYLQKELHCEENKIVIVKLNEALFWLDKRTRNRRVQRVSGTNIPHV